MCSEGCVTAPFERRCVAGVPFCVLTMREAVDWVVNVAARKHIPINVRLANAWTLALAQDHPDYFRLLTEVGINFPDGTPVVWFMNVGRRGVRQARGVRGPSFFMEAFKTSAGTGVGHFLLGASPDTLDALTRRIELDYPDCKIAGTYSPPFAPVDDDYIRDCADHIRASDADLVWVGLGTPKQDVVGTALAAELSLLTLNVGAAFDFAAGKVKEAPPWIQGSGFEWLYRFLREPRRLLRRYTYGNARFVWVATEAHLRSAARRRAAR